MSDNQRMYELEIQEAQRAHDRVDELEDQLNDGAMKAADLGLRTLIAINGAAIVSLLAFTGSILGRSDAYKQKMSAMIGSFWWFGAGVAIATAAMLLIVVSFWIGGLNHHHRVRTLKYPYFRRTRTSVVLQSLAYGLLGIAVLLGIGSISVFIEGCVVVHEVLIALLT
jgi:hypothetical protein